jgi:N-acetylmuramoyl-L-alanine amidase
MMTWRSSLCLSLLSMTAFLACQQSPVTPSSDGLEAVVSSAATNVLNGQGTLTAAKLEPVGDGRTRVVLRLSGGDARTVTRVNEAVAQALFGKLNNIVLETKLENASTRLEPLAVCPGSPMFTTFSGRTKPSTIAGTKITLNPGHGWTKRESGAWGLQRPNPNPNGSPPVYVQEDYNNLETAIIVKNTLAAVNASVSSVRNLDKNAGNGLSGNPLWQEAAKHHLERIAASASVWDSERDARGSDCQEDKDIRSRPLYANSLGSDVLIGLHSNAINAGWQTARGTRIYYTTENVLVGTPSTQQSESLKLANALASSLVAAIRTARPDLAWPDAQVIGSADYGETRFAQMPAVILETGFHTNPIDGPALAETSFRNAVATGIREGIKVWLGDTGNGGIVINPPPSFPSAPDLIAPGSPSTLEVSSANPVQFSWFGVQGATRYGLYISKYPYGGANLVYQNEQINASSTSSILATSDFRVTGENRYRWNMTAFNGPGDNDNGSFSGSLNFSVTDPLLAPSTPTPLSITMSSEGRMLLTWPEVANARDYSFTASFDGQAASISGVAPSRGTGLNAAVVTLEPNPAALSTQGKQVCFGVRANNATGSSVFSGLTCLTYRFYSVVCRYSRREHLNRHSYGFNYRKLLCLHFSRQVY